MLKETKEIQAQIMSYNHAKLKIAHAFRLIRKMNSSVKRKKFRRGQTSELVTTLREALARVNHLDIIAGGNGLPPIG